MTITNYKDQYLKVDSALVKKAMANVSDYAGFMYLTCKIGCDGEEIMEKINWPFAFDDGWFYDATKAVQLENTVYSLKVKNINSLVEYEMITTPIDLGYVADECTEPDGQCEMSVFESHFAPLFKAQIDAYFATIDIVSDVTVTIGGNFIAVYDLPEGFVMSTLGYNSEDNEDTIVTETWHKNYLNQEDNLQPLNFFVDSNGDLLIHWKFFDSVEGVVDSLIDGVYNVHIKIDHTSEETGGNGYETETMCAFIDILTKCLVATTITGLLNGTSKDAENVHLLHYALINGSNCGCNCADLCEIYTEILKLTIDSTVVPCGC